MIYYKHNFLYSIIIIVLIAIYFLIELGKISNGYIFEHLEVSKISTIEKIFPKIKKMKLFNFKTREKLKRNEVIQDVQEFDKQVFEYKDGGN
jgi:hypothetical protein